MIRCPSPLSEPMNISATMTITSAIDTAERKPTNTGCMLSQMSTSRKICHRVAPITRAAMIRCWRAFMTPYALVKRTISSAPNAAIATLLMSETPKISRNSGISADDIGRLQRAAAVSSMQLDKFERNRQHRPAGCGQCLS